MNARSSDYGEVAVSVYPNRRRREGLHHTAADTGQSNPALAPS